jgi:hypothetical protein
MPLSFTVVELVMLLSILKFLRLIFDYPVLFHGIPQYLQRIL